MADNLIQKLNTLANAINSKAGTTGSMTIDEMTTKVNNISAGEDVTDETDTYTDLLDELEGAVNDLPDAAEDPVIEPLTVTANGTYTPPSGVTGYSPVTVNVPVPSFPGASIETVTVTIEKYGEASYTPYTLPYVYYTTVERGVITFQKLLLSTGSATYELTVLKNSIVLATNGDMLVYDTDWGSGRALSGGFCDEMMTIGANQAVGSFWANNDFTIIMD